MALTPTVEICVVGTLSVLAFLVGFWVSRQMDRARPYLLAASLLGALGYAWTFSGRLGWAAMLPFATVVLWSNLMPVLLSFSTGLACRSQRLLGWRRPATIGLLTVLTMAYIVTPLIRPALAPLQIDARTQWRGEVCLQSHPASCAPAAAATLLHVHGVVASERAMADVCYTSRHGTEPLGLFRGLTVASRGNNFSPAVASANPKRWVERNQLPNIALVQFARGPRLPLGRLLGPRGDGHAIVVLSQTDDGMWLIADPAFGETVWTDEQFRERFTGDAIYLTQR